MPPTRWTPRPKAIRSSVLAARPAPAPQALHLSGPDGDFYRPADLPQALELLAEHPDAKLLAGGTDWGVEVNLRHARAGVTIAVDALASCASWNGTTITSASARA